MAVPSEPLSEDDFTPEVQIVSATLSDLNGEESSINYIRENEKEDFRPLNVQNVQEKNRRCIVGSDIWRERCAAQVRVKKCFRMGTNVFTSLLPQKMVESRGRNNEKQHNN